MGFCQRKPHTTRNAATSTGTLQNINRSWRRLGQPGGMWWTAGNDMAVWAGGLANQAACGGPAWRVVLTSDVLLDCRQ